MYPWMGNVPGLQQGMFPWMGGGGGGMQQGGIGGGAMPGRSMPPWMQQYMQPRGGGGMFGGAGAPQQLDWSDPASALAQLQTRFTDRFGDNQGLSGLWSSRSPTSSSPGGWQTATTQGQGGGMFGGLLGRMFG